jgi:hypothetical protein
MYQEYMDSEGADWQDEVMQSLDIEYHNVNPAQSLFYALEEAGEMERLIPHAESPAPWWFPRRTPAPPPAPRSSTN